MIGHHYDIIYAYITYMMKIHKREENPNLITICFANSVTVSNSYEELCVISLFPYISNSEALPARFTTIIENIQWYIFSI